MWTNENRARYDRSRLRYPSDLTDQELTAGKSPSVGSFIWDLVKVVVVAFGTYLTWFWLVTVYPTTQIAGYTFLTPLFGILAGAVLLGEHASVALFGGLVAIAVGMRLLRPR